MLLPQWYWSNNRGHSHWAWKLAKLGWKLPSNCTKFHPKLRTKNRKSECDFSNFARNFARCFVMRTHTAEKSRFYSHDFRIRSSFSTWQLNVRAAVSEFCIQYSCTYYTVYLHRRCASRIECTVLWAGDLHWHWFHFYFHRIACWECLNE